MEKKRIAISIEMLGQCVAASSLVLGLTTILYLIGRNMLGEAVIGLLYLLPIAWSAARWGQVPGISAALTAFLTFNFFFIPPFYTFNVGSLEGWLLLAIFLIVAVVVVGRIESGLAQARASERHAIFKYELGMALAGAHTREAIAHVLADHLQSIFQARLVQIILYSVDNLSPSQVIGSPADEGQARKPDHRVAMQATSILEGELNLWLGDRQLSSAEDHLLHALATQGAQALECARSMAVELPARARALDLAGQ